MSVAVVIRAFNEEAHIGRLLTGIDHQVDKPDEVILVDSGSTDATVGIAEAFGARIVNIARQDFSFGRALNRGIGAATADLVIMASAHVYPIFDDWISRLIEPFNDPEVGLAFGRQTVPPDGPFAERRLLEQWFPSASRLDRDHPFCNNANAAIRRVLWEERRYDERLTGLEDLAWAKALQEDGGVVAYVAEAPIVHVHNEAFGQVVNRYRREAIAHKAIYPEQSVDPISALRLCAANIAGDLAAARREGELLAHALDIFSFRIAQFYGTQAGFAQSGPVTESLKRRFYYPPDSETIEPAAARPQGRAIDYDRVSG